MKVLEHIEVTVLPPEAGEILAHMTRDDGAEAMVPLSRADMERLQAAASAGHKLRIVSMNEATSTVTIAVEGEPQ